MGATIKLRRGTDTALQQLNPILAAGEPIVVFCDKGQILLKIGDGKTPYNELTLSTYLPDGVSLDFNELNKISLAGFNSAYDLTIPFKVNNNMLSWVSLDFISSNSKLNYNANTGEIELCSVNGKIISKLDAAEFAVAGLIEDIGYDSANNSLVFIWNTVNGTKTSVVPLEDMLSPYTEGKGIQIKDSIISVKIDPETESYFSVTDSGLKVSGIDTALAEISAKVTTQLDELKARVEAIAAAQASLDIDQTLLYSDVSTLKVNVEDLTHTVTELSNETIAQLQDEVDTLSDAVQTLNNQDIQGMIDTSLEGYIKTSDIDTVIEDAIKDLDISIDRIDGGWITDVQNS